ncbi:hypothetical protein BKA01_001356 [Pseudonocardia eucalypti]|uniref:hypothetical protein n=1 Tax=Pseudonocardia eucalypti TaxID=648755 RepID=UPI001616E69A|nr:hypothetical protein [Pseudonocardia eucalypti]
MSHENTRYARSQAAYEYNIAIQNDKAAQVIASRASGIDDCIELLAMLGLDARAGRTRSKA